MEDYATQLLKRLESADINVITRCIFWKPVKILTGKETRCFMGMSDLPDGLNYHISHCSDKHVFVGRAMNQYFFQRRLLTSNSATLWLCFDVLSKEHCCLKAYHIHACRKERSIRFDGVEMEIISLLDKIIDNILYHSSVASYPGVSTIREVIVGVEEDILYVVMDYYPGQLLSYDMKNEAYTASNMEIHDLCGQNQGKVPVLYLYTEHEAKRIMKDLIKAVKYLHSVGIIHKDLKPENILLTGVSPSMYEAVDIPQEVSSESDTNSLRSDTETRTIGLVAKDTRSIKISTMNIVGAPRDLRGIKATTPHFPYQPTIEASFDWAYWDEAQFVCDAATHDMMDEEYIGIGESSLKFAKELVKTLKEESLPLLDYFLLVENASLPYAKNALLAGVANRPMSSDVVAKRQECAGRYEYAGSYLPPVVITDFGVSTLGRRKELGNDELLIYDAEGTTAFTSPECLVCVEGGIPGKPRDMFSLGVVLYTMIFGRLPYKGSGSIELVVNILNCPVSFPNYRMISPELQDLLQGMLQKDCHRRYNAERALTHPWFQSA